mmetsp:Transcript_4414/g.18816  ORF Transcript_4414/g.18816 Transcript_4414/m.18816 type:complete len:317 (+) Transcript_4414:118-1068(+)
MGAGGEATRRWASRRADVRAEAPDEAGGKSDLRRGTRGAFARGRRQTSYEKLHELADWKRIGLHDKYADATMSRPMTRGWLHIGIAAIATCLVASDGGRDYLKIRHEKSLVTFFLVTFVAPYWASTLLHFVPWKRRVAHDVALVLDFLGIASGFAGQTVAWCGERWWALVDVDATDETNRKVKINPDRVAAVAAVATLLQQTRKHDLRQRLVHVVLEAQLGGFAERARLGEERRRAGDVAAPQEETRRLRRARLGSHSAQARHFAVHAVPHRQSQRVPVSSSLSEPRDGVSDRIASLERASQVERGRGEDVFAART